MKLTQETDYAFRILGYLIANEGEVIGAPQISEATKVTERFTLRILRKLNLAGLTGAKRGAKGGYYVMPDKVDASLYDVIVAIQGPIVINRCLHSEDPYCNRMQEGHRTHCAFHNELAKVQYNIIQQFKNSKVRDHV